MKPPVSGATCSVTDRSSLAGFAVLLAFSVSDGNPC